MNERIKFVKEIIKEKQEEYDFLIKKDKESARRRSKWNIKRRIFEI